LFGHERGAFTDAHSPKPGLFEIADGGTLFLDEVATLPLELQAKLLRVLDDQQIRRVGGTKSRLVNVRITAATNDDLREAVRAGDFREDLFYRLNVVTHALPPLRDRDDDVILIAEHLVRHVARRYGLPVPRLNPKARSTLLGHHWPGNIRELKNAIERAVLLSPPGELLADELVAPDSAPPAPPDHLPFPASLATIMAAAAAATLERCRGNRSEAARQLSISRRRLARLLGEDH
jgi:DNA-binding NtrC family response regulator